MLKAWAQKVVLRSCKCRLRISINILSYGTDLKAFGIVIVPGYVNRMYTYIYIGATYGIM